MSFEMDDFPVEQINTGQRFPAGIDLHEGQCVQCGHEGRVALMRLEPIGMPTFANERDLCAECMADFVMAPMCRVYAQRSGQWLRIMGDLA